LFLKTSIAISELSSANQLRTIAKTANIALVLKMTTDVLMPRETASRSTMTKEAVPDEICDPRVEIIGDLKGKVEQVKLLDLDLTDSTLFPQMHPDVFWELALDGTGDMHFIPKKEFINLFNSTIMNLRDLPVFGTTGRNCALHEVPDKQSARQKPMVG
jgi:hypothetical protein